MSQSVYTKHAATRGFLATAGLSCLILCSHSCYFKQTGYFVTVVQLQCRDNEQQI